jgi:AraC-like DNA-binding protein
MITHDFPDREFINLHIDKNHIHEVMSLLIEQGISFHLSYVTSPPTVASKNSTSETSMNAEKQEIEISSQNDSLMKNRAKMPLEKRISEIYDKYITNGSMAFPPSQGEIVAELKVSLPTFKTHFKALYGKTFYQVYMDKKMEYAAQLLKEGFKAVEVSRLIGYGDKSCIKFNKMFQKHFGTTPKKYQMADLKK